MEQRQGGSPLLKTVCPGLETHFSEYRSHVTFARWSAFGWPVWCGGQDAMPTVPRSSNFGPRSYLRLKPRESIYLPQLSHSGNMHLDTHICHFSSLWYCFYLRLVARV